MGAFDPNEQEERVDRAVAARLQKLGNMPIDTARLEQALRRRIPKPASGWSWRSFQIRPLRAVAASIVILSFIVTAVFLTTTTGPALASASQMAQMHLDIVSGKTPVMQVDSIEAANRALAAQSPGSPQVPSMPAEHVMACCMKNVKDKRVACVLLKESGVAVTFSVAAASDMKLPTGPFVSRNGVSYSVQAFDKLSMVMTERNGKWLCLIGELPADRLMDIAAQVRF